MDLKSMLNDSGHRGPPRISTHTPQSSYDARIEKTPGSDVSSTRVTPYGPPLYTGDSRAHGQGGGGGGGGSYFGFGHSPHPNTSASTPSVGPLSAYTQSPGGSHTGVYTPRDSLPPASAPSFVSPSHSVSVSAHHPPTPGSAHHPSYPPPPPPHSYIHHNSYPPPNYNQFQSPPPPQPNGLPPSSTHHISPIHQYQSQPATPLGPPINYPKASPQTYHRPPSQGHPDHLRRASQSSISSILSKDYTHYPAPVHAESQGRDSIVQRQHSYPYDQRERSRSESVSPKTIPRPTPQREHSSLSSQTTSHRPSLPPQPTPTMSHQSSLMGSSPAPNILSTPTTNRQSAIEQHLPPPPSATSLPMNTHPTVVNVEVPLQQSLKRSASLISDTPVPQPPTKRARHDKPIWAQSARQGRPLRFIDAPPSRQAHNQNHNQKHNTQQRPPPQSLPRNAPDPLPRKQNGTTALSDPQNTQNQGLAWEASIANIFPFESLTRKICDWIMDHLGRTAPPPGSVFEIEAKVGNIIDTATNERLYLPEVDSEVLLAKDRARPTRFESSMNIHQHKALNEYLNGLVQQSMQAIQQGKPRHQIFYDHPKENDEFYTLSDEGKAQLNPELMQWIQRSTTRRGNEVRVRRSVNKTTGAVKAQIIKTRVGDKDIFNPDFDFDFRISISLESAWDGDPSHLTPLAETRGRNKDRMSYRHMMYQVDLTQISHTDSDSLEHELEVEVSPDQLRHELDVFRSGGETKYEEIVRGLVDNVRLLCRKGSMGGRR